MSNLLSMPYSTSCYEWRHHSYGSSSDHNVIEVRLVLLTNSQSFYKFYRFLLKNMGGKKSSWGERFKGGSIVISEIGLSNGKLF